MSLIKGHKVRSPAGFKVITTANGGDFEDMYFDHEYKLDLDRGLKYTRHATHVGILPQPPTTGVLKGFLRLFGAGSAKEKKLVHGSFRVPNGPEFDDDGLVDIDEKLLAVKINPGKVRG